MSIFLPDGDFRRTAYWTATFDVGSTAIDGGAGTQHTVVCVVDGQSADGTPTHGEQGRESIIVTEHMQPEETMQLLMALRIIIAARVLKRLGARTFDGYEIE